MQSASVKSHKLIANGKRWSGITKYERFSHTKPINNTKCQWRQAAAQTTQETINVRTIEIRITNHNNIFFTFLCTDSGKQKSIGFTENLKLIHRTCFTF